MLDPHAKICQNPNCTAGSFWNSASAGGACQTCSNPCLTCLGQSTFCTSCDIYQISPLIDLGGGMIIPAVYIDTFLFEGRCLLGCPNGTFTHNSSRTCKKCDPRCATCSSFRNCTSCQHNFYLLTFYDSKHTPCVP